MKTNFFTLFALCGLFALSSCNNSDGGSNGPQELVMTETTMAPKEYKYVTVKPNREGLQWSSSNPYIVSVLEKFGKLTASQFTCDDPVYISCVNRETGFSGTVKVTVPPAVNVFRDPWTYIKWDMTLTDIKDLFAEYTIEEELDNAASGVSIVVYSGKPEEKGEKIGVSQWAFVFDYTTKVIDNLQVYFELINSGTPENYFAGMANYLDERHYYNFSDANYHRFVSPDQKTNALMDLRQARFIYFQYNAASGAPELLGTQKVGENVTMAPIERKFHVAKY